MSANSPILISNSASGLVNDRVASLPEGLFNPLRQGLFVDEIRFSMTTSRVGGGLWFGGVPDALRVALKLGNVELTKGLVPAALLCRPRDWLSESPSVLSNFIWRLPKPLYLPQNGNIAVQVQQREDFRAATPLLMAVNVAAVGHPTTDPPPRTVDVPYASFFQGSLVTAGTVADQSTENDLRNPFRTALNVVRFSVTNWAAASTFDPTSESLTFFTGDIFDAPGLCGANKIQLFDQDGDFGVRDITPAGAFAALADRSWKVNAVLKPNAYFLADLSTTLSTGYTSTRMAVGMIGYRTIPLAELGVAR